MNQPRRSIIRANIVLFCLLPLILRADALDHWTAGAFRTTNSPGTLWAYDRGYLSSVTFGNGLFVASGLYGCSNCYGDLATVVFTSSNGLSWTEVDWPDDRALYNCNAALTFAAGKFVGVGDYGLGQRIMVSSNGFNWISPPEMNGQLSVLPLLHDVAYGNGRYVAVGFGATDQTGRRRSNIWYSTNGISWSSSQTWWPITPDAPSPDTIAVTFGNGFFVAVAATNSTCGYCFQYSGSDVRFSRMTNLFNVWGGSAVLTYAPKGQVQPFPVFHDVCYGNGVFVLAGTNIVVITNQDLATQTIVTSLPITPPTTNAIHKVFFGGGIFIAAAGRDILTSPDGFTWTNRGQVMTPYGPKSFTDITFGNGRFVAVSGTNFLVSDPFTSATAERPAGKLRISGAIGYAHQIQANDTLATNSWQAITNITLTNSSQVWSDPTSNLFQRFYRTQLLP